MITIPWLTILVGLFIGTYVVRAIPFWWEGIDSLPEPVSRFLELVPAAAIGALIFPDVFALSDLSLALITVVVSFILALLGLHLTFVVLTAVLGAWTILVIL